MVSKSTIPISSYVWVLLYPSLVLLGSPRADFRSANGKSVAMLFPLMVTVTLSEEMTRLLEVCMLFGAKDANKSNAQNAGASFSSCFMSLFWE